MIDSNYVHDPAGTRQRNGLFGFAGFNSFAQGRKFSYTRLNRCSAKSYSHIHSRGRRCNRVLSMKAWTIDVDRERDDHLFRLENELETAVESQNFEKAKSVRDKITRLQSGTFVEVLQAHMKFYKAFDDCSISDMARVWLQDDTTTCKHPVGPMISGYVDILNSFGFLFSSEMPSITPANIRFAMRGSVAFVTCDEVIEPRVSPGTLLSERAEYSFTSSNENAAPAMSCINIFTRKNGEYMLTHHASSYRGRVDEE